jgi:hypothetical protein
MRNVNRGEAGLIPILGKMPDKVRRGHWHALAPAVLLNAIKLTLW